MPVWLPGCLVVLHVCTCMYKRRRADTDADGYVFLSESEKEKRLAACQGFTDRHGVARTINLGFRWREKEREREREKRRSIGLFIGDRRGDKSRERGLALVTVGVGMQACALVLQLGGWAVVASGWLRIPGSVLTAVISMATAGSGHDYGNTALRDMYGTMEQLSCTDKHGR
ncbi:hypothetical protein K504DRAFT_452712 [Pleomassaria siparia CBS 279.74]|uniref:Uncharacterized protein n=1 Tax=Pleomassaria siparia CBS 279.74 TaxID=1314801 RepID=A0A6G1KI00_9PLEO|nr:hypothetical protein K504DRAFT_452712 [Pleomassaria siparia CBS 279.74]